MSAPIARADSLSRNMAPRGSAASRSTSGVDLCSAQVCRGIYVLPFVERPSGAFNAASRTTPGDDRFTLVNTRHHSPDQFTLWQRLHRLPGRDVCGVTPQYERLAYFPRNVNGISIRKLNTHDFLHIVEGDIFHRGGPTSGGCDALAVVLLACDFEDAVVRPNHVEKLGAHGMHCAGLLNQQLGA